MTYDLVIKNGCLVTSFHTFEADLAISGDKIAAVGETIHLLILILFREK